MLLGRLISVIAFFVRYLGIETRLFGSIIDTRLVVNDHQLLAERLLDPRGDVAFLALAEGTYLVGTALHPPCRRGHGSSGDQQ